MLSTATFPGLAARVFQTALKRLEAGGRRVYLAAMIVALALTPSSYRRDGRRAIAAHMVADTAPVLPWFTLLSALLCMVVVRIVVVTAISYGLPQYALEMLVRVLVLELIPMTAALFVAMRCTIAHGAELAVLRRRGAFEAMRRRGVDPLRHELLPRAVSGVFAVLLLASVSAAVALAMAYVGVFGFTAGGLPAATRLVGQVFEPVTTLIFALKTVALALAVALIPVTSAFDALPPRRSRTSDELRGLVRLFVVILLIEIASLMSNYY